MILGGEEMTDILIRVREVLLESQKSQTEIGKAIRKTPQYVWKLLNDDNANPSKSVIKDICQAFGINEDWINKGELPKDLKLDKDFSSICAEIGTEDSKAKEAIMKYYQLSSEDKELFWKFIERFSK